MVGESKETLMDMESVRKYLNSHGIFMSNSSIWYWGRKGMANKVEKRVNRCFLFCKREDVDRLIYARKKLFNASQLILEVGCNHNQIMRWRRRGMPKVDVFGSTFFDIEETRQWLEANHVVYGLAWRARLKKEANFKIENNNNYESKRTTTVAKRLDSMVQQASLLR